MKKIITIILFLISFSIYSQNRYEIVGEGIEKVFLSDSISKLAKSGIITETPIVVIDGIPYRFMDLENQKLPLSKTEIEKIVAIDKQKGISIFGDFGEAGVIIVTTNKPKK